MIKKVSKIQRIRKYSYPGILFILAITGFAQMPVFKRYYIADIPGLGWLAQFYTTHFIHYGAAALFFGLSAYLAADFLLMKRKKLKITASGYLRGILLCGIAATGILLVIRNSFFVPFSPETVIFLDIGHLGLVMIFLWVAFAAFIRRRSWTIPRQIGNRQ